MRINRHLEGMSHHCVACPPNAFLILISQSACLERQINYSQFTDKETTTQRNLVNYPSFHDY